jgi:hypothetical protein
MTTPPIAMSVADQFGAALSAPVPFLLAVVAVGIVIWKVIQWAYGWRYGGTIEKLEAMLRLVAEERRIASDRENALASTVDSLKATVAELENSKPKIEFKTARQLESGTAELATNFARLRQANTAIDEALQRAAAVTTMGSSMFTTEQQAGPLTLRAPVNVHPVLPGGHDPEPKVTVAKKPDVTQRSE